MHQQSHQPSINSYTASVALGESTTTGICNDETCVDNGSISDREAKDLNNRESLTKNYQSGSFSETQGMSTICKMANNREVLDNLPLCSGGEGKDLLSEDNRQVQNP